MKGKEFWNSKASGSVTIEYAFLLPVLLIVYTFIISIGLYQYNQCLLGTNVYLLAGKGKDLYDLSAQSQLEQLQQIESNLYNDKYFLAENICTVYQIRGSRMLISGSGQAGNPLAAAGRGEDAWQLRAECEVSLVNPAETMQFCKAIYKLLEQGVDINWSEVIGSEENAGSGVR